MRVEERSELTVTGGMQGEAASLHVGKVAVGPYRLGKPRHFHVIRICPHGTIEKTTLRKFLPERKQYSTESLSDHLRGLNLRFVPLTPTLAYRGSRSPQRFPPRRVTVATSLEEGPWSRT